MVINFSTLSICIYIANENMCLHIYQFYGNNIYLACSCKCFMYVFLCYEKDFAICSSVCYCSKMSRPAVVFDYLLEEKI